MNSFAYITSKFFPETDILKVAFAFPDNRSSVINTDFISYGFLNSLHFGKSKFSVLKSSVLFNMYIDQARKESMLEIFMKAQRTYHGFARFALLYKVKHSKIYNVDTDLYFNSLDSLSDKIITHIYDDKTRVIYKFRISDIISITKAALSNAPGFFVEPLSIKNPYTNVPFTISQLYHLYFVIKDSSYIIPSLFHHFFEVDFNLDSFSNNYECVIRDESLKIFLKTSTQDQKFLHIMKMITHYEDYIININIHPEFPSNKLVEGLSPFLKDYLYGVYSLNPTLRFLARRRLKTSLSLFNKLNPTYGRKIFRRNRFTDTAIDLSGATFNIYSPTNSYYSDPRPGHENLSFSFVDDIIMEQPILTPRQLTRRQRLRQGGSQPSSPRRMASPRRITTPRRYIQPAVQTHHSPQSFLVNEVTGTIYGDTESTDDSDDSSTIRQDISPMDISTDEDIMDPISRRYDGAEDVDDDSENENIINHLLRLEDEEDDSEIIEENLVSFNSIERLADIALADIASHDWPLGLGTPSDIDNARDVSVVSDYDDIRHTHENVNIPDNIIPGNELGILEQSRELVNETIVDVIDNIDDVMIEVTERATSPPISENFVSSIPVIPRQILVNPTSPIHFPPPAPSLHISPSQLNGTIFPPPPALPIPRHRNIVTSLESELSNSSSIVSHDSSDNN